MYFCWRHACPLSLSTPSDLTKVYTLPRRLNPWPRLTQFHSCLSKLWLIIFIQLSPGYVITTLHIRPRRTTQAWKDFLLRPRVSNCVKHFYLQSVKGAEGFLSLSIAKLSGTWQSCILLLVINSSPQQGHHWPEVTLAGSSKPNLRHIVHCLNRELGGKVN